MVKHFFSSDDMPPGQTPHTIMLFSHNDLVDAVQPGDRCVCVCVCTVHAVNQQFSNFLGPGTPYREKIFQRPPNSPHGFRL